MRDTRPMAALDPSRTVIAAGGRAGSSTKEILEMNGTMRRLLGRSVQVAVMATPSSSVGDAVDEARRRAGSATRWLAEAARAVASPPVSAASAA